MEFVGRPLVVWCIRNGLLARHDTGWTSVEEVEVLCAMAAQGAGRVVSNTSYFYEAKDEVNGGLDAFFGLDVECGGGVDEM